MTSTNNTREDQMYRSTLRAGLCAAVSWVVLAGVFADESSARTVGSGGQASSVSSGFTTVGATLEAAHRARWQSELASQGLEVPLLFSQTSGSGTIGVELQEPKDPNSVGIPQEIDDVQIAVEHFSSVNNDSIVIPTTAPALQYATNGVASYELFANFGDEETVASLSLPVTPAAITAGYTVPSVVDFMPFQVSPLTGAVAASNAPVAIPSSINPPPECFWEADGNEVEQKGVRIGQMQDSVASGSHATWDYSTDADSTFGVGYSTDSATGDYSASGTDTVSNSIGTDSGFPEGAGFNMYVDSDFYRQTYRGVSVSGGCNGQEYKTELVKAIGDSYAGSNSPQTDPYGRCGDDPYGIGTMNADGGHFNSDTGTATEYSAGFSFFGLNLSSETGYTSNIKIDLIDDTSNDEYFCGNGQLPDTPILWSNDDSGE